MKGRGRARFLGRTVAVVLTATLGSGAMAPTGGSVATGHQRHAERADHDGSLLPLVQTAPVVIRDISYAERDGKVLRLDVYRMPQAADQPALIVVHGGSWRRRSKEFWSAVAPLYAQAGYVVFAIDYRLAPPGGDGRFPDPVGDVGAAIEWVRRNSSTHGADPARIAVAGSSAGGHLALLSAASETAPPDALVLFSAPVDLARLHRRDVLRRSIEIFVGCPPELCPSTYEEASGRRAVDESTPPVLVAYSRDELIPRDQPARLVRRLRTLQRDAEALELRGTRHGMAVARATVDETLAFLDDRL